ncbi:MAG: hypothetical protein P8J87_16665, partial [Verrucomicrobiales bacterium]|nr:hypothetical protein [Verrucomicrobiales bacterium]
MRALGVNGGEGAIDAALGVLGQPIDRFMDYALWLTARELEEAWLPGLGVADAATHAEPGRLLFALRAVNKPAIAPLLAGLLRNPRLDLGEKRAVVGLTGSLGGRGELDALFGLAMDAKADGGLRLASLQAMGKAKQERGAIPNVDLKPVVTLFASADGKLRSEAIRMSGLWGLAEASETLVDLAEDLEAEWEVRVAAVEGLVGLGGDAGKAALEAVAAGGDTGIRVLAAKTLAKADVERSARVIVDLLGELAMEEKAGELVTAILTRKGGGGILEKVLEGKNISGGAASAAIRAIATTGQTLPGLEAKLRDVGGLEPVGLSMSAEEIAAMVKAVEGGGDPVKGEAIYRRAGLLCVQCHAIGGAGGRVGPDLVSIGASAPVDYLIESLMEPSKKVKEGYHLTTVTTKDGGVFAGTGARKTDTHLVLVNAANQEQLVPLGTVQSETIGQISLMPAGLTAGLSRGEFIDLTRFLHELGRTPAYSLGEEAVVRRWTARTKVGDDGLAVFSKVG